MKKYILKSLLFILPLLLVNCISKNEKINRSEVRNLYLELVDFPTDMGNRFRTELFGRVDTTYFISRIDTLGTDNIIHHYDTVFYKYKDAMRLTNSNLLDNTRKLRITYQSNYDSIGNPAYKIEVLKTEESNWKRISNSGSNPMRVDTLVSEQQFNNRLLASTKIYIMKFVP